MIDAVAIVGAGVSGAGAAYALRDADVEVSVFEQKRAICGRAVTSQHAGCTYDHGANYVKSTDETVATLLTEELDAEGLVDVEEPVWTFDADGTLSEGRSEAEHKWTYEAGIAELVGRLFAETEATVRTDTRVADPIREDGGWRLRTERGRDLGWFDTLLLTPPAPQTADLLGAANWEHRLCRELREAVAVVPYRTVVSTVLHYPSENDRPYYGLVNEDKAHDVWWASREECKAGHVPDGESVLVVQMSPTWSVDHWDAADDDVANDAAAAIAELLDDDSLAEPDWTDVQRWRYAQPDGSPEPEPLQRAADHDLFFAGDWVAGKGRVHAALRSGLETGERIATRSAR